MYWSIILQQLIIIIIAMSYITITFACFSNPCPCSTRCSCSQQPVHRQQSSYAAPFIPLNKLPGYYASPPSYSAPYPANSYSPVNTIPYSQTYNLPYTNNVPQSFPQQSYQPSPPLPPPPPPSPLSASYGPQIPGNIIPTPEIYNSPGESLPPYEPKTEAPPIYESKTEAPPIYESKTEAPPIYESKTEAPPIYESKTEAPPIYESKTEAPPIYESKTEVTPAYEPERHANEYGRNLQQTEVSPSRINSELIDDVKQYGDDNTDTTLLSQNVAIVPTTTTQSSEIIDNLVPYKSQMTTTEAYSNNEYKKRYKYAILAKRRAFGNQNILIRQLGKSRKRFQERLPCLRSFEDQNQMVMPISDRRKSIKDCITLLNLLESNIELKNLNANNAMNAHTSNNNHSRVNLNINTGRENKPSMRNDIRRRISRAESLENLKSADILIADNRTVIALQRNRDNITSHDYNKSSQKHQNPDIGENMSQEKNINLIGTEKFDSQNTETITENGTTKRASLGNWTIRSDKLFPRTFGGSEQLKKIENRNYYTTYYHQTCTGEVLDHSQNGTLMSVTLKCDELDCVAANIKLSRNRILEITFLKNITGRFKSYGSYCISKQPIDQVKSGHILFGAKDLPRTRRFYNELIHKKIHNSKFWDVNKRHLLSDVKPTVIDCKDNMVRCRTNSLRQNITQN